MVSMEMEPRKQEHVIRWRTCNNPLGFIRGCNLPTGEASGPVGCPSTPNVQPLSLSWISCILNISQCSFKIWITKPIYETITYKLDALVSKAWKKWCRCLDFCLRQSWTPGQTPSKSSTWGGCWGREMKWLQCYLGEPRARHERATSHWFIYVHSDMHAALLLFYLPSVCSGSQRKRKEEGKVKSQPFFYLHWDMAAFFVPCVCLKEMRLIVGIVRAQQVLMDTRKEISGDRQQQIKDCAKKVGMEVLELLDCKNGK